MNRTLFALSLGLTASPALAGGYGGAGIVAYEVGVPPLQIEESSVRFRPPGRMSCAGVTGYRWGRGVRLGGLAQSCSTEDERASQRLAGGQIGLQTDIGWSYVGVHTVFGVGTHTAMSDNGRHQVDAPFRFIRPAIVVGTPVFGWATLESSLFVSVQHIQDATMNGRPLSATLPAYVGVDAAVLFGNFRSRHVREERAREREARDIQDIQDIQDDVYSQDWGEPPVPDPTVWGDDAPLAIPLGDYAEPDPGSLPANRER